MKRRKIWLGSMLGAAALAVSVAFVTARHGLAGVSAEAKDLVVHEWGTFLAMSGSDGVTLEGMYHEEHALPPFVHARSRDQLRLPSVVLKGETPVIYFYTRYPLKVRVEVRFPKGLWTQWYPQARIVGPQLAQTPTPVEPRGGRIRWCADITPVNPNGKPPALPATSSDALWNHAREVDAAYVTTADITRENAPAESERFLFYRGLGRADLPVRLAADAGGTLGSSPDDRLGVRHVFVLRVEGGRGAYAYYPELKPGRSLTGVIPSMDKARPMAEFTRAIADELADRLVASGLYAKEARAMVNTWRNSYFQTEGIRVLFVLPQAWTDAFIPLAIEPRPLHLVRVMVGRVELLSPERERLAERAVRDLAARDAATRERAFATLRDQGRYVEPIVRRVLATTEDQAVRTLCRRLLLTDFVTELRSALHAAGDGRRVHDDPEHVRAQLAVLLRELGLNDQAKAEAEHVLKALRDRAEPSLEKSEARSYLRAYARAMEALGDDRGAAQWYGKFITFGGGIARLKDCTFCHQDAGPRDMAWFRGWWAGRRYAEAALRAGRRDAVLAEHRAAAERQPADAAARMRLAYLYESLGAADQADALWAALGAPDDKAVAVHQPPSPPNR